MSEPALAETPAAGAKPKPPTLSELFTAFVAMSLSGFGGVLPWARRKVVEERRWMTPQEFNEAFSLCQFLPGPNIVNFSVVFGSRMGGAAGALVALIGLLAPPVALVIVLAALYAEFGDAEVLRRILLGLSAAAAGLIVAVSLKMAEPVFRKARTPAPYVALAVFAAVGILRWPLPYVLLALVPLSIALAWWRR
jgi:chromate transporter